MTKLAKYTPFVTKLIDEANAEHKARLKRIQDRNKEFTFAEQLILKIDPQNSMRDF